MTDRQPAKVHQFFNDYKVARKKLKIKSINNFHLCLIQCLKGPNCDRPRVCERQCYEDLERYLDFKHSMKAKVANKDKYFYEGEMTGDMKDPKMRNVYNEYLNRKADMEISMQNHITVLGQYLDNEENKYKKEL